MLVSTAREAADVAFLLAVIEDIFQFTILFPDVQADKQTILVRYLG